jgi:hypothetical protein
MTYLLSQILLVSFLSCGKAAMPATPMDVAVGTQQVDLRLPLEVQDNGVQLVLMVRDASELGIDAQNVATSFESTVPTGSFSAVLTGLDGSQLHLTHTGYTFYKGYKGLVLTGAQNPVGDLPQLYSKLEVEAKLALSDVRILWIDRAGLTVRDVYPRL